MMKNDCLKWIVEVGRIRVGKWLQLINIIIVNNKYKATEKNTEIEWPEITVISLPANKQIYLPSRGLHRGKYLTFFLSLPVF